MLIQDIERYIALRQSLGFKLASGSRHLRAFARFAVEQGDTHVRSATARQWAASSSSPLVRYVKLRDIVAFVRFIRCEDPAHELPLNAPYPKSKGRRTPYIYTPREISDLMEAAGRLRPSYPMRRQTYATLVGLVAATGLRLGEALGLRLGDIEPEGILRIRDGKNGKERLLPMHPSAISALDVYLDARTRVASVDDHLFLSSHSAKISSCMAEYTFRRMVKLAHINPQHGVSPRIHDIRHTFATTALEKCTTHKQSIGRHMVALATYLGHCDIANTYWYLEATPVLMADIASAAEALFKGERP